MERTSGTEGLDIEVLLNALSLSSLARPRRSHNQQADKTNEAIRGSYAELGRREMNRMRKTENESPVWRPSSLSANAPKGLL